MGQKSTTQIITSREQHTVFNNRQVLIQHLNLLFVGLIILLSKHSKKVIKKH